MFAMTLCLHMRIVEVHSGVKKKATVNDNVLHAKSFMSGPHIQDNLWSQVVLSKQILYSSKNEPHSVHTSSNATYNTPNWPDEWVLSGYHIDFIIFHTVLLPSAKIRADELNHAECSQSNVGLIVWALG